MIRDEYLKNKRKEFVKLCIQDNEKAAQELHNLADALSKCNKMRDQVFALSQIFCVSEVTIERDLREKTEAKPIIKQSDKRKILLNEQKK